MQMIGPIFRLARGILLHLRDNVASSSASSYINTMDFFNLFRSSLYLTHFISTKVLKRYATCLLERCP